MIVMKIVWLLLGISALLGFAGLSAQSATGPIINLLTLAPVPTFSASGLDKTQMDAPVGEQSEGESDVMENRTTSKGSNEAIPTPSSSTVAGTVLFDYDDDEPRWYTVNDDVMGGSSTSVVDTDVETGRLVFSGSLSLENNGGFASARSSWSSYDLTGDDGIVLRLRGDGRTYQFRIRSEETGSEIAYAALIDSEAGIWKDVYVSFEEMVPVYRGVIVPNAPALNPGSIRSFGLMLADKQEGDFRLEVEMISAVTAGNIQA